MFTIPHFKMAGLKLLLGLTMQNETAVEGFFFKSSENHSGKICFSKTRALKRYGLVSFVTK